MRRSHFLAVAGVLSFLVGIAMIVAPDAVLAHTTSLDGSAGSVVRWLGASLIAVGVVNFFARTDAGSDALRAVMTGNIVLHVVSWGIHVLDYRDGIVLHTGFITGSVVHGVLAVGFVYYLGRMGPRPT